jgi:hypothetical protein
MSSQNIFDFSVFILCPDSLTFQFCPGSSTPIFKLLREAAGITLIGSLSLAEGRSPLQITQSYSSSGRIQTYKTNSLQYLIKRAGELICCLIEVPKTMLFVTQKSESHPIFEISESGLSTYA